ncbi:hypothetical protein ACFL53_02180 [Pseudomonadota bacterium]
MTNASAADLPFEVSCRHKSETIIVEIRNSVKGRIKLRVTSAGSNLIRTSLSGSGSTSLGFDKAQFPVSVEYDSAGNKGTFAIDTDCQIKRFI